MKKIFKTLLLTLLILLSFTNAVFALNQTATITSLTGYENKVEVKGSMSGECTAIAVLIYKDDNLLAMETKPVEDDNAFSVSVDAGLIANCSYTIKIADFDGGPFTTQNFIVKQSGGGRSKYVVPNTGIN